MSETSLFYTVAKYAYHHARNTVDALILSIELAWRYLRIYNVLRRGGHVIADRYVYDLLSGSTRNVTGKRRSFATVFCRLFPRPDVFYLLWNDPREIARRKSDLDESRARLMLAFYESAARRFGARVLKTDRPVDELARLIVREDLSRMIAKMAPRRLRVYTNTLL